MSPPGEILVLGYGNELRSDDAIGPIVARNIGELCLPRVRALALQQLTPELADPIAAAAAVIFVDAAVTVSPGQVRVGPVKPADLGEPLGHLSDPRQLLALAEAVFGRAAPAWFVTIGARNVEVGEILSEAVSAALVPATEAVRTLVLRALEVGIA